MKRLYVATAVLLALGGVGLIACSGSGSSTSGKTVSGVITGFGSVFVNGVEYDTAGASVSMDGVAGNESGLQPGMTVTLQATPNTDGKTGTASSIMFADVAEGVVLAVNLTQGVGTINVMGQEVQVNTLTVFKSDVAGVTLDTIPLNSIAEVSGYSDGSGTIYATRIEIKKAAMQPGDILEVKGVVSNLGATTFQIGTLVIDYSSAVQLPGNLADGLYVEVRGATAPVNNGGVYTFAATHVEIEDDGNIGIGASEGDDLQLQGVVMAVDAMASTIVINGQLMQVRGDAMRNGLTLADLTVGTYIQCEAEYTGNQWQVKEIEVGRRSDVEIKSTIEAVDTVAGTITVMGQTISVDSNTLLQDDLSVNPQHNFNIGNLQPGDWVEVDVYLNAGQWIAAKLMREDPAANVKLEGKVTSVAPVQVAGINVSGLDTLGITPAIGLALQITGTWDSATATLSATAALVH